MPKLENQNHERFCRLYIRNLNASASWRDVRGGKGRPTDSDRVQGSRLLTNAAVQERIAELIEERNKALQVDANWVLQELVDMAKADPAELTDPETGAPRPLAELPLNLRQTLTGVEMDVLPAKNEEGNDIAVPVLTKVRWTKRKDLLQLIGKHVDVQAFKDKHEHELGKTTLEQLVEASRQPKEAGGE